MLLVIPGSALFLFVVHAMDLGHTVLTPPFMAGYVLAAVLQVGGVAGMIINPLSPNGTTCPLFMLTYTTPTHLHMYVCTQCTCIHT